MSDKKDHNRGHAGERIPVLSEQEFVPCIVTRTSFVNFDHLHTCTLDNDHNLDHPGDGHACPCGWYWHG